MPDPTPPVSQQPAAGAARTPLPPGEGVRPGSVWTTGQVCSRDQRRGRYTRESMNHPGKMLPSIARYLITTYTQPGQTILDPMAGIGTTLVEAMHLGRRGVGVEYETRWAHLASANLRLATDQGATGTGEIYTGDSRQLLALLPPSIRGRVALVITSPPYGPSTHGHVRTPGARRGKVSKIHHRYSDNDTSNLAYQDHEELAAGFTQILAGCAAALTPGGHVAITARPYRRHGELIDIPGMVIAAGANSGLHLVDRCAALIAGVRNGKLVPRASFFQIKNLRAALTEGDPQWLVSHEDVLVFAVSDVVPRPVGTESGGGIPDASDAKPASFPVGQVRASRQCASQSSPRPVVAYADHWLDSSAPARVDRRPQPAYPANAHPGSATDPRSIGRELGRTPNSCPSYPRPVPGSTSPDAIGSPSPVSRDTPRSQAAFVNTSGRR